MLCSAGLTPYVTVHFIVVFDIAPCCFVAYMSSSPGECHGLPSMERYSVSFVLLEEDELVRGVSDCTKVLRND